MEWEALGPDLIVLGASHHFRLHLEMQAAQKVGSPALDWIVCRMLQCRGLKVWQRREEQTHLRGQSDGVDLKGVKDF